MRARVSRTKAGMAATSARSSGAKTSAPAAAFADARSNASLLRRATATTRKPSPARRSAMARPRPRLAPVTMTLSMARELSRPGHRQIGDEAQPRRRHMGGQTRAAGGEDFALQTRFRRMLVAQHDVGDHQCAGDRIRTRENATRAHRRMRVERRLHLLGMNLGAADVDDSAAPTEKKQPIAATLDHVPGIDEAPLVRERARAGPEKAQCRAIRAQLQRAVDYPHPHGALVFEPGRGKAGLAVIDGEGDAGLGRGIGMLNSRARVQRPQRREHGIVGDLARKPDTGGIDPARLGAHQDLAPMGRRAGDMRDACAAEADQERVDAFIDAREREGTASANTPEKNLPSAKGADGVKSRPLLRPGGRDRNPPGSRGMHDKLRRAAGARPREY